MKEAYLKYFASKRAAERWEGEMIEDLREVGERYLELQADLRQAKGQNRYGMDDRFPVSVDDIEEGYNDTIIVRGHWTRRGCTDKEECSLPKSLVYGSDEQREVIFADLERQIEEAKVTTAAKVEAKERAEFEALKAKFEGGDDEGA